MTPNFKECNGEMEKLIKKQFSSIQEFETKFIEKGLAHFGSGWLWLVKESNGQIKIIDTHDGNTPIQRRNSN